MVNDIQKDNNWTSGTLGELVDFKPKRTIKKGVVAPFVAMADIPENSKQIANVATKEYKGGGSRFINGDTVFARITPCLENGKTAYVKSLPEGEVGHGSTEFIVFAANYPEYDLDFIYYLARLPEFRNYAKGKMEGTSGRQRVSWQSLAGYPIQYPSKEERKIIGDMLAKFDEKIELNRQVNETLEGMAQALFKSLFLDFDPVIDNALKAGNPIPEPLQKRAAQRQALGDARKPLPEVFQNLFPNDFQHTDEMGWIPKGWELSTIGEEISIVGGGTPSTKDETFWCNGTNAFCTPKDMSSLISPILIDTDRKLTEKGAIKVSSGKLPIGTVLLSSRAPIGYLAIADIPVTINQGIIAMITNNSYPPMFLYYWIKNNMEEIISRANGSTFLEISKKNFRPIPFLKIPSYVVDIFNEHTESILLRMISSIRNIEYLKNARDTLLPKLLSGEVRIPEAERIMDDALRKKNNSLFATQN